MNRLLSPSFLISVVFIFLVLIQARVPGLVPGHHGWNTSQDTAIAINSNLDNGFVGHAVKKWDGEQPSYWYFTRSPIFTYLLFKGAYELHSKLESQLLSIRYLVLIVFFISFLLSYLLLSKILPNSFFALSATLLAFSTNLITYYNDMITQEMFTNLGMIITIWAIYFFDIKKKNLIGALLIFLGLNLGWGYSQLPILGLWCIYKLFKKRSFIQMFHEKAVYITLISTTFIACHIVYNAYYEANFRGVQLSEAGIFASAKARIGINNEANKKFSTYSNHILKQVSRVGEHVQQFKYKGLQREDFKYLKTINKARVPVMILFIVIGLTLFYKRRFLVERNSAKLNYLFCLLALAGFGWLLPMKNLALPHNYTSVVYFGFYLLLYSTIVRGYGIKYKWHTLSFALIVFIATHSISSYTKNKIYSLSSHLVEDSSKIRDYLSEYPDAKLCYDNKREVFMGSPYAMDLIFNKHFTTSGRHCDFLITKNKELISRNLLNTRHVFLIKKN